jgi:hypothetical protein
MESSARARLEELGFNPATLPRLLALLPFLCILLWLKGEEESVVAESIYTLF